MTPAGTAAKKVGKSAVGRGHPAMKNSTFVGREKNANREKIDNIYLFVMKHLRKNERGQ